MMSLGVSYLDVCMHQLSQYIELEPDGSDAWRASEAVDIIRDGGIGVIPTDSCYAFVTSLESKEGVERILRIKVRIHNRSFSPALD